MQAIEVRIDGLADTLKHLDGIKSSLQKKILKDALSKAAKVVLDAERSAAPISTDPRLIPELLKISLGTKVKVYRSSGVVVVLVGPRTMMARDKKTKQRKLSAFGRRAQRLQAKQQRKLGGKQTPTQYAHLAGPRRQQQFMASARDRTLSQVKQLLIDEIWAGIVRSMNQ
jgi:hypothetical protein